MLALDLNGKIVSFINIMKFRAKHLSANSMYTYVHRTYYNIYLSENDDDGGCKQLH